MLVALQREVRQNIRVLT